MSTNNTPLSTQIERNLRDLAMLERAEFRKPASTRIIAVANQKGGVGKTTSTVNIAAGLALGAAHPVGTPSTYDVIIGGAELEDVVQPCPDIDGVLVCPATIDLSGAEIELVDVPRREFRLREALRQYVAAHGEIDVVLIDCPPSLGLVTLNVMVAADEVMIPIQAEYYALEGLSQLWNTVERIGVDLNPGLRVSGMLLTMADKRTRLSEEVEGEVRSHFPDHTFTTVIPRSVRISEAPSYAQTVVTYDPRNVGAIAYRKAALELCERLSAGE